MSLLPVLLATLAQCAGIEVGLMSRFWFAVGHAANATAVQFREALVLFEAQPIVTQEATGHFWDRHMQPWQLMAVLESLVEEGRLARATATVLEDCLLQHVAADGRWQ
jgi:hypothetical protein